MYRKNYMHKKFVHVAHENQKKYIKRCARKGWIGRVNPGSGVEFQAEIKPFRLKLKACQARVDRPGDEMEEKYYVFLEILLASHELNRSHELINTLFCNYGD